MIAVQALEKRTKELKEKEAEIEKLKEKVAQLDALKVETAALKEKQEHFQSMAARLEALELRLNFPVQAKAVSSEDLLAINP
jgi:predicted nuclease with TOPRIM domain